MRSRHVALGVLAIGWLVATANLSCKGHQEHGGTTTPTKEHGGTATGATKEHGGAVAK